MRYCTRSMLAVMLAAGLVAAAAGSASAQYNSTQAACRSAVAKNGSKYAKSVVKSLTGCHKSRDKDGALSGTDCNDSTAADAEAGKLPGAAAKLESGIVGKCVGVTPSDVLYEGCPIPCDGVVPAIASFTDVSDCVACLTVDGAEDYSVAANGTPSSPLTDDADLDCHSAITKNTSKFFNTILKSVAKCQATQEKPPSVNTQITICTDSGFDALISDSEDKCRTAVAEKCAATTLPGTTIDACGDAATPTALAACVCDAAKDEAQELVTEFLTLSAPTTTTTLPVGDPQCPNLGEIVLYSRDSQVACTDNTDCTEPRTCDTSVGLCKTAADLDSGWIGVGHNGDINDQVTARAHLYCPGPAPTCGECDVVGIDPGPGNCRCGNSVRTICDQPLRENSSDCPACEGGSATAGKTCSSNTDCNVQSCDGRCSTNLAVTCAINTDCSSVGAGTCSTGTADPTKQKKCSNGAFCSSNTDCAGTCTGDASCDCYLGPPFPLNSGGTHACIVSRFSENVTGTANVDLGAGEIDANLRSKVFLGITGQKPCPVCAGKCSDNSATCLFDSDCTSNDCVQDVPDDGIRNGVCSGGANTNQSCDANGSNATFPAILGGTLPAGGQYSIDCQPSTGLNVSGVGLQIDLHQTTGVSSMTAALDCDGADAGTALCPCLQCSKDKFVPCNEDSDCASQGSFCSLYNNPTTYECTSNDDCASLDLGNCAGNNTCLGASGKACATNADCQNQSGGTCDVSSCSSIGQGTIPSPNGCSDALCSDVGNGEGRCLTGADDSYCDGLVRIDGRGMKTCSGDIDCAPFGLGSCALTEKRPCYLDPIVATGDPDPEFPVAGAVFCIPPTENAGINLAVGLPGPGRIINQGAARTFCAGDNDTQYQPGIGGCP
jgi:hypothetical protein